LLELSRLLVQGPGLPGRLLLSRAARRRIRGRVGHVLHEVLLVALRGLQRVARLLEALPGRRRIAALAVEPGRLVPGPRHAVQARGVEGISLFEEQCGGLARLARVGEDLGRLLVVAALEVELRRPLDVAQALEVDGRRVVLLPLEVDLDRLGEALALFQEAPGRQVAALLLVALDLLLNLGFRVAGAQDLAQHRVLVHRRPAQGNAGNNLLVYEEYNQSSKQPRAVRKE